MKKKDVNILIVDDDQGIRDSLSEFLKRLGYTPVLAPNAAEALSVVRIKTIHAAIVDCLLPKMNGVDLAGKLRESRFGNGPLIFMSGIFRDKSFASESIEKTDAIDFLFKPVDLKKLEDILDDHLGHLTAETTVPLHSLISKGYESARERRKAIEMLEEISGFDLPFVLSVLMDAKVGGHLNIANSEGEIYGISLKKGKIINVDSSETFATLTLLLIQKGFVTGADLEELGEKGKKGDILKTLVNEALVSPHVVQPIRTEQMLSDLRRLFVKEKVKFNFVQERSKDEAEGLDIEGITPLLQEAVDSKMTIEYLKEFYSDWGDYPILKGPAYAEDHPLLEFDLLTRTKGIIALAHEESTMADVIGAEKFPIENLYKSIHLLTMRRLIIFDTVKRGAKTEDLESRYQHMYDGIADKNPIELFVYFGSEKGASPEEVDAIYKEFAKNNHPDKLPKHATKAAKDLANKVFSLVSSAHDILTDSKKRKEFSDQVKHGQAKAQIMAEQMAEEGMACLRKGQYNEAFDKLKEAYQSFQTEEILYKYIWTEIKAFPKINAKRVEELSKKLNDTPHEGRRSSMYQFVLGLVKKAEGDILGASACFDKALSYDVNFLDARRELVSLKNERASTTKSFTAKDLLTGDLSEIMGHMFKKKG